MNEQVDRILDMLQVLADKLGVTEEYLFGAFVKSQFVAGYIALAIGTVAFIVSLSCLVAGARHKRNTECYSDDFTFNCVGVSILLFVITVIAFSIAAYNIFASERLAAEELLRLLMK